MAKACGHGSCLRISQAVTGEGTIWTCGGGDQGQLGHGDEQDRLRPMGLGLEAFGGLSVVLVTCCCWHHLQGCRSDVSLFRSAHQVPTPEVLHEHDPVIPVIQCYSRQHGYKQ